MHLYVLVCLDYSTFVTRLTQRKMTAWKRRPQMANTLFVCFEPFAVLHSHPMFEIVLLPGWYRHGVGWTCSADDRWHRYRTVLVCGSFHHPVAGLPDPRLALLADRRLVPQHPLRRSLLVRAGLFSIFIITVRVPPPSTFSLFTPPFTRTHTSSQQKQQIQTMQLIRWVDKRIWFLNLPSLSRFTYPPYYTHSHPFFKPQRAFISHS